MRRLIVCSDGTWNNGDQSPDRVTNVVKLARALLPFAADGTQQILFYDPGVGSAGTRFDRLTAGAFGVGLSENIKDAYRFLVHNYLPGDDICLFGFSRGAYTVRSTAGLIRKCGILHKRHSSLLGKAFEIYREPDKPGTKTPDTPDAARFRRDHSYDPVPIKCIGVWDTVGALGIPGNLPLRFITNRHQFHDVRLSSRVQFAFQALAIDERRKVFEPAIWEQSDPAAGQVLEQVWFAGDHCDVGGGRTDTGLSNGVLRWMVDCARRAGLEFEPAFLADHPYIASSEVHHVRGFPYLRTWDRPIGLKPHGHESVHATATDRRAARPEYRPRNLEDYLNRQRMAAPGDLVTDTEEIPRN